MLVNSEPARICISNFSLHWIILIFCSNKTICFACFWSVLIYTAASPQACLLFFWPCWIEFLLLDFKRLWIFPRWLDRCRFSFLLVVAFRFLRCCLDGLYWKWQGHGARGRGILVISISRDALPYTESEHKHMRVNNAGFQWPCFCIFSTGILRTFFRRYKSIQVTVTCLWPSYGCSVKHCYKIKRENNRRKFSAENLIRWNII